MAPMSQKPKLIAAVIFTIGLFFFLYILTNSHSHRQLPPNIGQEGLLKYFSLISIEVNSHGLDEDLNSRTIDSAEFRNFVVDICERELHQFDKLKTISIKRNHDEAFKESTFNLGITFYFEYAKSPQLYYRLSRTSMANTYQYYRAINHPYESLATMDKNEALKIYTGEISRKLSITRAREKNEFLRDTEKVVKGYCHDLGMDMNPEVNETKKIESEL